MPREMFNWLLQKIKLRSNVTLRQWSRHCQYIIAQRSRRFQQQFNYYSGLWGDSGFRELLRNYRIQFVSPKQALLLNAVGTTAFDWNIERINLTKFEVCQPDMDFIERVQVASHCETCRKRPRKFCHCESHMNWEPYVTRDSYLIWKREEKPSLYSYKIYGHYDDVSAKDFLSVQTDIEYRKQWDKTVVNLEVVDSDSTPSSNSHLIYWEMRWPRLFANRDYVYCRRIVTDMKKNAIYIYNRSTKHSKYPEHPEKVRVNEYWSYMVIKPYKEFNEPGIHYVLTYFDDPGMALPGRIKSWVTQNQMPDFLNRLYHATKEYAAKAETEAQRPASDDSVLIHHGGVYRE